MKVGRHQIAWPFIKRTLKHDVHQNEHVIKCIGIKLRTDCIHDSYVLRIIYETKKIKIKFVYARIVHFINISSQCISIL